MAIYRLTKPCFLGAENPRYFPEGSVIDWNGPPNKAMEPVERRELSRDDKVESTQDMNDPKVKARQEAHAKRPAENKLRANPVVDTGGKGATKPMPDWAPQTRPAFSVPALRDPKTIKPGEDEASIVRMAASPPGAGSHPSEGGAEGPRAEDAGRRPTDGDHPGESPKAGRRGRPRGGARRVKA